MYENVFAAGRELTAKSCRPNVLISDMRDAASDDGRDIERMLAKEEINVCRAVNGSELLARGGNYHMMIIRDGGMDAPAFGEIERVRNLSDLPLITVSDCCTEIYRIMALSKGADICMDAESFGVFEFKARVVAMLRRYLDKSVGHEIIRPEPEPESRETIINGEIILDRRRREIFSCGRRIRMTSIEYGIVEYLMENCGNVCTVEDIYRRVWRETPYSVRKTVVEHIRRIRSKIEPDPHNPSYIKVVFGIGYKMERQIG